MADLTLDQAATILGVSKNIREADLKKHWRKLALRLHPDRFPLEEYNDREAKFKEAAQAYEVMNSVSDLARRTAEIDGFILDDDINFMMRHLDDDDMRAVKAQLHRLEGEDKDG